MNVADLRRSPEAVVEHIADGANVVVGVANGEPVQIVDTIAHPEFRDDLTRRAKEIGCL